MFMFTPIWGIDPISRAYVSNGLVQPPTRFVVGMFLFREFWGKMTEILMTDVFFLEGSASRVDQ